MSWRIDVALGLAAGLCVGISGVRAAEPLAGSVLDAISAGAVRQLSTQQTGAASGPSASVNQSTTITGTGAGFTVQQNQQGSADGAAGSQSQTNTCTGPCASSQATQDTGPGGRVDLSQSYTTDPPPPPPRTRSPRPRWPWLRS